MKRAFRWALKDLRVHLFASTIVMAQFFLVGMLLIWFAVSVPSVWRSLVSFVQEDPAYSDRVFVEAGAGRKASAESAGFQRLAALCDQENGACSVVALDKDWVVVIGALDRAGQIKTESGSVLPAGLDPQNPFVLAGSRNAFASGQHAALPAAVLRSAGAGLSFNLLETGLLVAGRLASGAYYLDANGKHLLDNRLLLCLSFRQFLEYGGRLDFFLTGLQLQGLSTAQIADLTDLLLQEQSAAWFRPISMQEQRQKQLTSGWGSIYFLVFIVIYYTLIISGMTLYLMQMAEANQREYAVHRMCGASLRDIRLRLLFFIGLVIAVPTVFLTGWLLLMRWGGSTETPAPLGVLIVAAATAALAYYAPARQITRQDIAGFARPD